MALFKNAATEWEKTMTENDLDQMEAQGLDVSKYREKLAARRTKEAEEAKRDRELYKNPTQLDKMKPYMQTPRSSETEFFKETYGKGTMAGQKQVVEKIHGRIYRLRGDCQCPGRGVERREAQGRLFPWYWHTHWTKGHMNDMEWLKRVMEKLRNMCEGRQPVAPDVRA